MSQNDEVLILPATADNPHARRVDLSMQVTTLKRDTDGQLFSFKFARFVRDDGIEVVFPWEQLKEIVLEWIEVEKEGTNE
jgi:hypothetical protein